MKKQSTLQSFTVFLLWILCIHTAHANVWRVNNRAGTDADFQTISQASNSGMVTAGDTLYIEASSASHGEVTLTKSLVLIGPGFFLAENPETQADHTGAQMQSLTLAEGSQGSVIKGLTIRNLFIETSNLLIEGNYILNNTGSPSTAVSFGANIANVIFRNNYVRQTWTTGNSWALRANQTGTDNVQITNNYIEIISTSNFRYALDLLDGFSGIVKNNVISGNVRINNTEFHNNILRQGSFSASNAQYTHNIGNSTQFGTANSNQQNINMSDVFVGPEGNSTDGQWKLKIGSPASSSGIGGTDIGMFGGSNPYKLSGLPNIPSIYQIQHSINYQTQTLEVEFSTKSNN